MSEVEELRAEVERLRAHEVANGCIPRPVYEHLAKVAREHADALDRVEALRDRWLAVDVPSAEVTSWSHYAGAALRAALAVPVTGDTEDASPAAEDAAPSVLGMAEEIYRREDADSEPFFRDKVTGEPCPRRGNVLCTLPYSPDHRHVAAHMWDAGAASPTEGSEIPTPEASGAGSIEQATEGGAK